MVRCRCKIRRTILHYQDAIEKPVEDNTDDLKFAWSWENLESTYTKLTTGPVLHNMSLQQSTCRLST